MIYVKLEKKKDYYVCVLIHYKPFDEKFGLKKTELELLKDGIFVENLPEKGIAKENHYMELRATLNNKELYYEETELLS